MTIGRNEYPPRVGLQILQEALRLGLAVVTELWSFPTQDWVSSVHAADIDGDGDIEVLTGSRDGSVRVLTRKAALKWSYDQPGKWFGTVYAISTAEAFGGARVLVGSHDSCVYAFDELGRMQWQFHTEGVVRRVRACDIDRDGQLEVIVGSEDWSVYALSCATGEMLWKFDTKGWVRTVFTADIDGDGEIETLAASGDRFLYILDGRGKLKWRHYTGSKIHSLFAIDLDHDGVIEILFGSDAKDILALTPDGKTKWRFSPENRIHSLNAVDINGDGRLEVIAGSEDEHIYFLDEQGNLLWKHYLGFRIFSVFGIDLNRDGIIEILVGSEDNNIRVLRVEITEGLLEKIEACYQALGSPPVHLLDLSPTERQLLKDITDSSHQVDSSPTMEQVQAYLNAQDYLQALSMLMKLDLQRVQVLWQKNVGYVRTLSFAHVVDDQPIQMVVGTDKGDVRAIDVHGAILWSTLLHDRINSVQAGDIDSDGDDEIIVGTIEGFLYVLSRLGDKIKWHQVIHERFASTSIFTSAPDGVVDMALVTEEKRIHLYRPPSMEIVATFETPAGNHIVSLDDIDGDGLPEILVGAINGEFSTYRRDGTRLWTYRAHDVVRAVRVRDIDGDGRVEILVGSEDRNLHVLNHNGEFKWRYLTQHRILDVDAFDIDGDGRIEVMIGVSNGLVLVLDGKGDLLWQFQANDRIRVVRAADLDGDGKVELVVSSEDRFYLLQAINPQQFNGYVARCRQALQTGRTSLDFIDALSHERDSHLRAFALAELAAQPELTEQEFRRFNHLLTDNAYEVKKTFAYVIASLYRANPECARRYLDPLSSDRERDVRFAFIDSLPELTRCDPQIGFEYLDRYTRNVNKWIRRTIVRKLDLLAPEFPEQAFRLLLGTIDDEADWIRQESARVLAHYFDIHTDRLVMGARLLMTKGVERSLFELITRSARKPVVQNVFQVLAGLLSDLNDINVQERLKRAVDALQETRKLLSGDSMWEIQDEFYRLHSMRSVEDIAGYRCLLADLPASDDTHFSDTLQVFHRLDAIAMILRTFLRREGLGDRLASLLEAITAIEALTKDIESGYFRWNVQREPFSDQRILALLLARWLAIVTAELGKMRGRAELRPELQTQRVRREATLGVWLRIYNDGRSPADNVKVKLIPGEGFTAAGPTTCTFETIPTRDAVLAEFTIRPRSNAFPLAFEISYDDAEAREKVLPFGDQLDTVAEQQEFQHIPNPYIAGVPIQHSSMFYGRDEELLQLQENLTNVAANTVIVLYGQRRTGKSSLLYQLLNTEVLRPHVPVLIDMQRETLESSTSRFLLSLARSIYRHLKKQGIRAPMPQRHEFEMDATFALDLFLDDVQDLLEDRKLILLIDEFEVLEQKVNEGKLDREIFAYLRSLMQHRHGINFLMAGTHTIEQLTAGYWSVFLNIAHHYRLSKLSEQAAVKLITKPVEAYLEYDAFAIEKIRQLTGDQPYLIQLICRSLVAYCNNHHKSYVTINDVNIVQKEVMETGHIHFNWIRDQSSPEERILLSIIAQESGEEGRPVSLADIERVYHDFSLAYQPQKVLQALSNLTEADIIEHVPEGMRYRIGVGLTRRWLRDAKPLKRVLLEEDVTRSL